MNIITRKKSKKTALFLIIAGLGALWLTFWWTKMSLDNNSLVDIILYSAYYIFNSIVLILAGVLLYLKNFKTYSFFSLLLGISVTASLFIFDQNVDPQILGNLFLSTILQGMGFGMMLGGTLLVPMFLYAVYSSFLQGIQSMRGKINYMDSDIVPQDSAVQETNNSLINNENKKSTLQFVIPFIGIMHGLFYCILHLGSFREPIVLVEILMTLFYPVSIILCSLISILSNNKRYIRISNIIIVIMFILQFIYLIAGLLPLPLMEF